MPFQRCGEAASGPRRSGVDDAACNAYVAAVMNLLLLLSALLSALTGGASAMRAPAAAHAVASAAVAVRSQARAVRTVSRPIATVQPLIESARAAIVQSFVVAPAVSLYASRRRE